MPGASSGRGLRRSLSVWQAVGLSIALMAPSMAANINPQGSAATAGRAVPLAFLIAAVGVLLVAYTFVRLCQYYHHSGSVYAFVGATLGPRAGVVAGWGLLGTYTFYAVVTSSAAGIFGTAFLSAVGVWPNPPSWAPFLLAGVALVLALLLAVIPARRGTNVLLTVEGTTVALILIVTVVVLVRLLAGNAPGGHHFTLSVFAPPPGTSFSPLFLGVVFGFLSFAGLRGGVDPGRGDHQPDPRHPAGHPRHGDLRRHLLRGRHRDRDDGLRHQQGRGHRVLQLVRRCSVTWARATSARWVGDVITLGTTISAFGCCLASTVGGVPAAVRAGPGHRRRPRAGPGRPRWRPRPGPP